MNLALRIALLALLAIGVLGCSSGAGPYTPQDPATRDPQEAQRLNEQAAGLMNSDPRKAETLLREALTADLYFGPAHNNLGVLYLQQDKLYQAAGEFEWARKLLPGHPDPRLNLGLTLQRAGRVDEALAAYAAALEVYPGHLPTIQAMTACQLRHNRQDENTLAALAEIAYRSGDPEWRDWARSRLTR